MDPAQPHLVHGGHCSSVIRAWLLCPLCLSLAASGAPTALVTHLQSGRDGHLFLVSLELDIWRVHVSSPVDCPCSDGNVMSPASLGLCTLGRVVAEVVLGAPDVRQCSVSVSTQWKSDHGLPGLSGICWAHLFLSSEHIIMGTVVIFCS